MLKRNMRNRVNLSIFDVRLIEVPLSIVCWISRFCMINVLADKTMYYQTSPCPNYSPWKKAIAISGAVLRSSGEFHGDCRITFQVPYPDRQRFLLRFESVGIQECHDRLVIYDSDDLVDAVRLEEISCRSQVDPTRFMYTSNKGGYVTIRYYTYNKGEHASEFRLVLTAINKLHRLEPCGFRCANGNCISTELRCDSDHVNHCGDNSDELNCRNSLKESASQAEYAAREYLGLSISVTLIISLSVLFVIGVCVCSVALFVCKRNQVPGQNASLLVPGPTQASVVDAISSSEATSSTGTSRSVTNYAPVYTGSDELRHAHERHESRVFHGKSRPSPLLAYHPPITHTSIPSTYSGSIPGSPRFSALPHRSTFFQANPTLCPEVQSKKPVVYF